MNIKTQFSQKNTIINLSYYEIYYQISMGKLFSLTNKKDFNVNLDFTLALGSIFEVLNDIQELENQEEIFNTELKKQASMDAVQNFANENLEDIKNRIIKIDEIVNLINDNLFFDETMNKIVKDNYNNMKKKYEDLITDELSLQIQESLNELIK